MICLKAEADSPHSNVGAFLNFTHPSFSDRIKTENKMAKISKARLERLSRGDVEHVAMLSRLKLSDEEISEYTQELGAILDYVDELNSTPTENVEPISQISGLKNIAREDEITESLLTEKALENAPDRKDNFIRVKKVFE